MRGRGREGRGREGGRVVGVREGIGVREEGERK